MLISIKWFPPSWFYIKTENRVIYIDPAYLKTYFKDYPEKIEFSTWPDEIDGLPEKDLEKADLILITHHHKDHCKHVTVKRLKNDKTVILAPEICKKELKGKFKVVKSGEEINFEDIKIKVVDAYNTPEGHSTKKFHKKGEGIGYLIKVEDKTIYHAGGTDFIPEMNDFEDIDVALIPIGGTFTMDMGEAVDAVLAIKPRFVIPMHMKDADPEEFKKLVEEKSDVKVLPLEIGGIYEL
ncbi:MAG: MBL fold metallo-hydrolase [Methanobacterium sp.]|jgi:L-ascorbate metabolism protein UlaG (beta-lactamase superfamily)